MDDSSYGLGLSNAGSDEQRRLHAVELLFDGGTFRHLATIGIAEGMRCLELGGGGGSVARWMAERVGPSGSVLVTDIDVNRLVGCDEANIEVRVHDVCTDPLDDAHFDVIHARLLLEHLPSRLTVLDRLVTSLRPGGWLLVEDFDFSPFLYLPEERLLCEPKEVRSACRAILRASVELGAGSGWDAEFGRDLPVHLTKAGLGHVDAEGCAPLILGGTPQSEFLTGSIRQLAAVLVDSGFASRADLDAVQVAFENPGAMIGYPMISAWGCRTSA